MAWSSQTEKAKIFASNPAHSVASQLHVMQQNSSGSGSARVMQNFFQMVQGGAGKRPAQPQVTLAKQQDEKEESRN